MTKLTSVDTWLYHLGDVNASRAREIAATNADLVITEWADYSGVEAPYTAKDLKAMRGDDYKLILSYLSVGEAETYRYYWKESWEKTPPVWVDSANPEWIDNIKVRYWDPDWQNIVFDYSRNIADAGFNGLYLDIVSAYEYWEKQAPGAGIDYRAEMAAFVQKLDRKMERYLERIDPDRDFYIIGQNGLELIEETGYLNAIDGVAKEDLQFYYEYGKPGQFEILSRGEYRYHLDLLKDVEAAGKASFVVEYVPDNKRGVAKDTLTDEAKALGKSDIPIYVASHRDLDEITPQPKAVDAGLLPPLGDASKVTPITGTAWGETLRGTDGADEIYGKGGGDSLYGKGGGDVLIGGDGLDNLYGGRGADDLRGGQRADLLKGGNGADRLKGGKGADELFGGKANDVLIGGKGGDEMAGGAGKDQFVFVPGSGEDEILDFDVLRDTLDIAKASTPELFQLRKGLYIDLDNGDGVLLRSVSESDFDPYVFI